MRVHNAGVKTVHEEQPTPEHIIDEWMLTVFRDGGIERFDDLHIDNIDETWHAPQLWIEGGLAAFRIAVRLRDLHELPVEVVLGFSLKADDKKIGIDFRTQGELAKRLDWTPPSLYLFQKGMEQPLEMEKAIREGHVCDDAVVEEFGLNLFDTLEPGQRCFYTEFRRTKDAEFRRNVLLQG